MASNAGVRRREAAKPASGGAAGPASSERDGARFTDDPSVVAALEAEKKRSRIDLGVLFWLFLAIFVTHYFDIIDAVLYDPRVDRDRLFVAGVLIGVSVAIGAYAIIVVEIIQGKDYMKTQPWTAPLATICALSGWGMFWVCMWPVWRWMSILIVPSLFMGLLLGVTLLPF